MSSYKEDEGKTVVRIEQQDMKKLGIKPGDIVTIYGNKNVTATCLPTDITHQEKDDNFNIEYLNKPKEFYPIARLSNTVFSNARMRDMGSLVKITKFVSDKEITSATIVTLSTIRNATTIYGGDYTKRIDFAKHSGNMISKGDVMNFPLTDDPTKWQNFSSIVLDVKPSNNQDAWMIQENTKFELREVDNHMYAERQYDPTRLIDLIRVVPIVKKLQIEEDIQLTIPFLEIYENGAKIFFYLIERIHQIDKIFVNGMEMTRPVQKLRGLARVNMEVTDNHGNSYSCAMEGAHGGGATFPSGLKGWEFYIKNTTSYGLWPPIGKDAKELIILVREFFWHNHELTRFPRSATQHLDTKDPARNEKTRIEESGQTKYIMTPMRQLGLSVISGPWEFKICLK